MKKNYHMRVKEELPDEMRSYDLECNSLSRLVSLTYKQLFCWVEETDDEARIVTLLFLGKKLLAAFLSCKNVFETRGRMIRDENCMLFDNLVCDTDKCLPDINYFMQDAENVLKRVMKDSPRLLDFGKKRLIVEFKEASAWMAEISEKEEQMRRMRDKCIENRLHYNPDKFGMPAEGFKQQAYAVLCSLTLLTVPSMEGADENVFVNLYKDSFGLFCSSKHCKANLDMYKIEIDEEYSDKDAETNEQKIEVLKDMRRREKKGICELLGEFGIKYTNTRNDYSIGQLGRDLYLCLNAYGDNGVVKMSNKHLCDFFLKEARMEFITNEIARLKKTEEDPCSGKDFFAEHIRRTDVRHAVYDTIQEKQDTRDGVRYILGAQAYWLAVFKVMEANDMIRGNMRQFADLMNEWFPVAPHPCNYRSMISVAAEDVKPQAISRLACNRQVKRSLSPRGGAVCEKAARI